MIKPVITALVVVFLIGCSPANRKNKGEKRWKFSKVIALPGISPIGIIQKDGDLWISDVENNRIVVLDTLGGVLKEFPGFQRPMHLTAFKNRIYVPEYTADSIRVIEKGSVSTLDFHPNADGIGGVAVNKNLIAATGFYNHRLILRKSGQTLIAGREGHSDGELYYPTDVDIHNDLVYVADAYNNRVQVFDLNGNYVRMIGWNDSIDVATGVFVSDSEVYIADFEGARILIFDIYGKLKQTLDSHLEKPTDIFVQGNKMFVADYGAKAIVVYNKIIIQNTSNI